MTTAEDRYFASGTRLAVLLELDQATGRPAATNMTPYYGKVIYGVKGLNLNVTEPRKITHVGQDRPLQIDWLPATEAMDAELTASATELDNEAAVGGTKTQTVGTARLNALQNSQMGFEPTVGMYVTRQTENISGLRRWESYVFSAAKVIFIPSAMTDATADVRYKIAPAISSRKLWGEAWSSSDNGATTAQLGQMTTLNFPYLASWKVTSSDTVFPYAADKYALTATAASVLGVWANDVLIPSSDYTTASSCLTFATSPGYDTDGAGKIVTCLYEGPLVVRS